MQLFKSAQDAMVTYDTACDTYYVEYMQPQLRVPAANKVQACPMIRIQEPLC